MVRLLFGLVVAAGLLMKLQAAEALYAAIGGELRHYAVDVNGGALEKRASVTCPAPIQYVWQHPSKKYLYAAWSDGGPSSALGAPTGGSNHGVSAFRVDASGALQPHGQPAKLGTRPVHISTDASGRYLLVAHTIPSELTVHHIQSDGTLGAAVVQKERPDAGVYAHQVRADPALSGKRGVVILTTRGNVPVPGKAEDPGALKVFDLDTATGQLRLRASITPGGRGGIGFQPRHVDFHPSKPWVFVSVEGQNQLQVYRKLADGIPAADGPLFNRDSLRQPRNGQAAGAIHVHPNGRFVYQSNRYTAGPEGENSIAVYAIDAKTGEPSRVQNMDTQGLSPRTFTLDPGGRLLVAGNQIPGQQGPANMAVFQVMDGKLEFVRKYDLPEAANGKSLFWIGFISLP